VFNLSEQGIPWCQQTYRFESDIFTVAPGRIATDRTAYLDQLRVDKRGKTREQVEGEAL